MLLKISFHPNLFLKSNVFFFFKLILPCVYLCFHVLVIVFQNSSKIQATVLSQDTNTAVIKCLFKDGQSHFCLVCCSSNSSFIAANVSTSANATVTVDLYGLGTSGATVLYCNASAQNVSQMNCNHHDVTTSAYATQAIAAISGIWLGMYNPINIVLLFRSSANSDVHIWHHCVSLCGAVHVPVEAVWKVFIS